jgi:23S rRNA pseudouridine2605 synthase
MERIQKILAAGGIASRRAAEKLITDGRVRVNGGVVSELGAKADARNDRIEVDGKRVVAEHHVYIVLHKPRGVVATMSDPEGRPTVREILAPVGGRVYPVGRLDFATSGVLLATNDGDFAEGLLHPKRAVPKTYVVKVNGKMAAEDMDLWRNGVRLEDGMTAPAEAKTLRFEGDKTWFELTIKEGRNQQIRRMGEATGFPVMRLARLSFANIDAEGLRPGQWRHMTRDELVKLKKTYGVPKSISSPPERVESSRRTRTTQAGPGGPGRPRRGDGEERARPDAGGRGRGPREGSRGRGPREGAIAREAQHAAPRGPNTHRTSGRGSSIATRPERATRTERQTERRPAAERTEQAQRSTDRRPTDRRPPSRGRAEGAPQPSRSPLADRGKGRRGG